MEIIVTIGPSSLDVDTLVKLRQAGATSFRINLSHSSRESLHHYFKVMASAGIVPAIDTQGPQLRIEYLTGDGWIRKNEELTICFGEDESLANLHKHIITVNHPEVIDQVEEGDRLKIDFGGLVVRLHSRLSKKSWCCVAEAEGRILNKRAIDIVGRTVQLDPLTDFDKYAIEFAANNNCKELYASFVSSAMDISIIKSLAGAGMKLISKIETATGLTNHKDIMLNSDAVLIDRGDLSREISIPAIPIAVRQLLASASNCHKPLFVATNVLDSMIESSLPSRAEVSDIYTMLSMGVSGIVLAAEVAIGKNPVQSTALVEYLARLYTSHKEGLYGIGMVAKPDIRLIGEQLHAWL